MNIDVGYTTDKRQILKASSIRYMGGQCLNCNYNRCHRSLHFHHLDPSSKDFNISSRTTWVEIEIELEKCVLLCANCHGEAHEGLITRTELEIKERQRKTNG